MKPQLEEKWKKLLGMSGAEMVYRIHETLRLETDRVRQSWNGSGRSEETLWPRFGNPAITDVWSRFSTDRTERSFKRYLMNGPAQRFYLPGTDQGREQLREVVEKQFSEWKKRAVEEADRLCHHRVELLGYGEIELCRDINWHRDPITGGIWPRRFWADYDLVHDAGSGDPKTIHEMNRHQHLPRLAKAYFLTGEEKYAREAVEQIRSWVAQNPAGLGVNWHSSLEIGLRVVSWLWTIFFLLPAASLDEEASRVICASLLDQLEHIYRYPSIFSSPNTHLIGEATALLAGGLIFKEYKRAAAWREMGAALLVREMEKQVSNEGIHGELSSCYHCHTLDFYLQALLLADRNHVSFPKGMWKKLGRMLDFLMHLTRPDGTIPLIGDDDGGRALALHETSYRTFPDALCTGAVLFGRPDLKYQAKEFCEETLWMLGPEAWRKYGALKSAPPSALSASYPAAGYFIQRTGWDETAGHLVFDCGGMGIINGGHAHADALSFVLFAGRKELLSDPGTFTYNSSPEWRNYFRSTRAHNTATVDGRDQSEPGGTFRWRQMARSRLIDRIELAGAECVEAEHNGYSGLPDRIIHRRRLLYCKPDYWLIVDDFLGEGEHTFDLHYHLGPEVELSVDSRDGCSAHAEIHAGVPDAGLDLILFASAGLKTKIARGQYEPIQGWVSSRYGEKRSARALRCTFRSKAPASILTFLLPWQVPLRGHPSHGAPRQRWAISEVPGLGGDGQTIACEVRRQSRKDFVIHSNRDSEIEIMGCKMRGEFFWLHGEGGALKDLLAVNARSLNYNDRALATDGGTRGYLTVHFDEAGRLLEEDEKGGRGLCAEFAGL